MTDDIHAPRLAKLIYISGSGRSGSTLVERLLHSSPDIFAVGELHCLWRLDAQEITCSCGKPFTGDPFWSKIGTSESDLNEMMALEATVSRSAFIARHRFDLRRLAADPRVRRFLDLQFALYDRISQATGARYIVDSSKAGPRAWLLACDQRTRILHLYRRPEDVIASWRSEKFDPGLRRPMNRKSIAGASADWWKVEQLIRLLPSRIVTRLSYAALCARPRDALNAVLRELQITDARAIDWIDDQTINPDPIYHSLNGNPDRFDHGAVRVSQRKIDWARHAIHERPAIRAAGLLLKAAYPEPTQI